jgi:hypothetical protein
VSDIKNIRFLTNYGTYNAGERAGFSAPIADELVRNGLAEDPSLERAMEAPAHTMVTEAPVVKSLEEDLQSLDALAQLEEARVDDDFNRARSLYAELFEESTPRSKAKLYEAIDEKLGRNSDEEE